jgi:hypothetical protein
MSFRLAIAALGVCLSVPVAHAQRWRLVEDWRVGGEVEGAHSFQDVRGLELLPGGGLVVLEYKDQQVHFLDARGKLVRTVGRTGAGPGEYQNANGLVLLPNGNLVINDPDNNRFTMLGPTGTFIRTVPMDQSRGFGWKWDAWAAEGGRVAELLFVRRGQDHVRARVLWSADLATSDTIFPAECPAPPPPPADAFSYSFRSSRGGTMMMIPFSAPRSSAMPTTDGGTWKTSWPAFATITYTPAGSCAPTITIPLAGSRVAIPEVVRDSAVEQVKKVAAQYGPTAPDLSRIPRSYPPFDAMVLDEVGQLWVSRHLSATQKRFEVYSRAGLLVGTLDMPPTLEPLRPMIITADRMYGFVTDADDLPHLVAYRIVK